MAKLPFVFYLHHDDEHVWTVNHALKRAGHDFQIKDESDLWDNLQNPFYEIGIDSVLDTETGEIETVGIHKRSER